MELFAVDEEDANIATFVTFSPIDSVPTASRLILTKVFKLHVVVCNVKVIALADKANAMSITSMDKEITTLFILQHPFPLLFFIYNTSLI